MKKDFDSLKYMVYTYKIYEIYNIYDKTLKKSELQTNFCWKIW